MKAFLFGLGLGFGLGVLFAPMSGQETRDNLSERANDLADTARQKFEEGRERVRRGVGALRNVTERATSEAGETTRPTGTETTSI
jgi:gas vesicle protein